MKLTQRIVQCASGSYFITTWVPGASLQALRMGNGRRIQYCPVHHKSEMIRRVSDQELTPQVRAEAVKNS